MAANMRACSGFRLAVLLICVTLSAAFQKSGTTLRISPGNNYASSSRSKTSVTIWETPRKKTFDAEHQDRRSFGVTLLSNAMMVSTATNAIVWGTFSPPAVAAYPEEKEDKTKLLKGYERLTYLLDHWETETTICQYSGGTKGCERSPENVMVYMGYKSTVDPLFKADKTLKRLSVLVSDDDGLDYIDAMEKWLQAAEEANGMAYVSSWGEANPGGGKDRVQLFIERSKKNVQDAHDALGVAIDLLHLERP